MQNSYFWTGITSLYVSQTSPVLLYMQNSVISTRMTSLYGFQASSVVLSTHNNVLSTRTKRLYCLQPSHVVLCMQNIDFRTRITSLYVSQTSPVVLCMYNSVLSISLCWSQTSSRVFACKTAWIASESLVSMGPSTHVWFLDAKQRLLDRNNKSLCLPDTTCRFVYAKQRD